MKNFGKHLIVYVGSVEIVFNMDLDTRQWVVDWRNYANLFNYLPVPKMINVVINSVAQNEALHTK